ncbi:hypothetical protein FGO68_gene8273 [Halteria grandinella]|uniref:Transmembrane protein n=1 Tax=Halteria grandinella TaxID=5974 RepID=A0A8J8SXA0_HALGN|nr:hypothetical protein FGO68_gene8273 [Halteria grandinella]
MQNLIKISQMGIIRIKIVLYRIFMTNLSCFILFQSIYLSIYKNNQQEKKSISMLTSSRKSISQEYQLLIQKHISKPKQKNQFTKKDDFAEEFKKKKIKQKDQEFVVVQIGLPKTIKSNNIFRLHSNVQFPRNANSCYQLGDLNIDFYSYNYKIVRLDRRDNLTIVTYDPIDRPFMPVETVKEMLGKGDERLLQTFEKLHKKKLDVNQYQILDQQALLAFENSITKPFIAYVSKVEKDRVVTKHRIMNHLYLAYQGINEEMLIHYAQETGLMTIPFYFSENDYNTQHLSNFFLLNTYNNNVNNMILTNYRGEKFPIQVTFHSLYTYDPEEQCYYEHLFFIWDVEKKYLSKQKILENYQDYFNLKSLPSFTTLPTLPDITELEEKRCGFKKKDA